MLILVKLLYFLGNVVFDYYLGIILWLLSSSNLQQAALCLSELDQSPPASTLESMQPFLNAIVKPELLKHQDRDVKLLVATCICEITRITAPEAPYSDDVLKVHFLKVNWLKDTLSFYFFSYSFYRHALEFHSTLPPDCSGYLCRIFFAWLWVLLVDWKIQVVHHLVGGLSSWRLLQNIGHVL